MYRAQSFGKLLATPVHRVAAAAAAFPLNRGSSSPLSGRSRQYGGGRGWRDCCYHGSNAGNCSQGSCRREYKGRLRTHGGGRERESERATATPQASAVCREHCGKRNAQSDHRAGQQPAPGTLHRWRPEPSRGRAPGRMGIEAALTSCSQPSPRSQWCNSTFPWIGKYIHRKHAVQFTTMWY